MIFVKFKNLEKSELAREAVHERIETLVAKFPDLAASKIQVTLEMENSPLQAGPDVFKVKLHISGARYNGLGIEKAHSNLYIALADVADHMLESLNRFGDRVRVRDLRKARQIAQEVQQRRGIDKEKLG